jgi:hypothetical protein
MAKSETEPRVFYRDVRYARLEFRTGSLQVILPRGGEVAVLMDNKKDWINKKEEFINECLESAQDKELVSRSEEDFRNAVNLSVQDASSSLGVEVNSVRFRLMKTKWASCSPKRNLTLNSLMRYLPEYLIAYVIFHETAHIIEKKHNDRFWRQVANTFKNHNELEKDLFSYWFLIQAAD